MTPEAREEEADRFELHIVNDYTTREQRALYPFGVQTLIDCFRRGDESMRSFLAAITGFEGRTTID